MKFNKHSNLEGCHAFLGASKSSWLNYDEEKLIQTYRNILAKERGTRLHELAAEHIALKIKMPRNNETLNMYVNDGIGYDMEPEVLLYFSNNCFGTADTIKFDEKKGLLRIHDLKTGTTPTHEVQTFIYAALFCLEYNIKPGDIEFETRIYQNDEKRIWTPDASDILPIMDKIKRFDKILRENNEL